MKLIDADALMRSLTTLDRLAKSDAQAALLGRVYYIVSHFQTVDGVSKAKVKELMWSGLAIDTDADREYVCELIDELEG